MRTGAQRLDRIPESIAELAARGMPTYEFVAAAGDRLRHAIPFDGYCMRLCDPETAVPNGAVGDGPSDHAPLIYRHEYSGCDFATLPGMRASGERVTTLSQATGGNPQLSGRWREVLEPMGITHELCGMAREEDRVWGHLILYRQDARGDFSAEEARAVERALRPLTAGIRRSFMGPASTSGIPLSHAPAVIVLDEGNRITEHTPVPAGWQQAIDHPGNFVSPLALQVLAVAARGDRTRSARNRIRCEDGSWISMHATAMGSRETGDRVAIVIQPAHSTDLAPLMFASLGLTRGEQAVAEHVLQGRSTKEMAATLYISPHTVQDRLKSIFAKLGVRSRRELVAKIDQRLS